MNVIIPLAMSMSRTATSLPETTEIRGNKHNHQQAYSSSLGIHL